MITYSGVDFLYRSGDMTPQELLTDIKKFNIKKVISFDSGTGIKFGNILPNNMEHIMNPINIGSDSLAAARSLSLKVKNGFMDNSAGKPLLVHCKAGTDITGLAIALYKEIKKNVSCTDAIRDIKSFGGLGPSIGLTADQFIQVICESCKINHQHFNQENQKSTQETEGLDAKNNSDKVTINLNDISNADDIANLMRAHLQGPTAPIVNPQQSFAPYMDPNVDRYPGIVLAKKRRKILNKILDKKNEKEDSNDMNIPQIGQVNNYQGAPNSQISAPSGSPGAPNAAAFSDPGGWVQL